MYHSFIFVDWVNSNNPGDMFARGSKYKQAYLNL